MVRDSYCQQVMTIILYYYFWSSILARLKLQFKSGTPLFKSLDPPLIHSTIHVKFCRQHVIMYIRFRYISRTIVGNASGQGKDNVCNVLINKFIVTAKQIIYVVF